MAVSPRLRCFRLATRQGSARWLRSRDHDIVTGIPEAIAAGPSWGLRSFPVWKSVSPCGQQRTPYPGLLSYSWQDPELNRRLASLRESRHSRNPQIIERLRALGLDVTYEEVRALGRHGCGRPSAYRAALDGKHYVTSAKDAFDRYLADGRPAYVARELPSPADPLPGSELPAGVAVLAHPTWAKVSGEGLNALLTTLKAEGLGGIEVHYKHPHEAADDGVHLDLAKRLDLLITGEAISTASPSRTSKSAQAGWVEGLPEVARSDSKKLLSSLVIHNL